MTRKLYPWLAFVLAIFGPAILALVITYAQDGETSAACHSHGTSHPCHCLRMVAEIQERYTAKCEKESATAEDYQKCMDKMPSHCEIISSPSQYYQGKDGDRCSTHCHPENCQCSDSVRCQRDKELVQ